MHLSPYYILNLPGDSSEEEINASYLKLQKKYINDPKMLEILDYAYNEINNKNYSYFSSNKLTNYNRDYTFDIPHLFKPSIFQQNLFKMFNEDG